MTGGGGDDCGAAVVALACSLIASVVLNAALLFWACTAAPPTAVELELQPLGASLLHDDASTTIYNREANASQEDAVDAVVLASSETSRSSGAPQTGQEI